MNRNWGSAILLITAGAIFGHIATTGQFPFHRSAGAEPDGRPGQ